MFKLKNFSIILSLLLMALVGGSTYKLIDLSAHNKILQNKSRKLSIQVQDLEDIITKKDEELSVHRELLTNVQSELRKTGQSRYELQTAVQKATEAVNIFNKLSQTDKELLAKYSKVYFLNEHYTPQSLADIQDTWTWKGRDIQIKQEVLPFLLDMLESMKMVGLNPKIVSAYRSFGTQEQLKLMHKVIYGTSEANKFVADQGFSEHQIGTAVDIVDMQTGGLNGFEKTKEYKWLVNNAHKYGFVLSYPQGNAYYAYEPWHWRFVGKELGEYLYKNKKYFYDLPQRKINTYLIKIFDN